MIITVQDKISAQNVEWILRAYNDPWLHIAYCDSIISPCLYKFTIDFDKDNPNHEEPVFCIIRGITTHSIASHIGQATIRFLNKLMLNKIVIVRLFKSIYCDDFYDNYSDDCVVHKCDILTINGTELSDILCWQGYGERISYE